MFEKIKGTNSYRINVGFSREAFNQARAFDPAFGIFVDDTNMPIYKVEFGDTPAIGKYGIVLTDQVTVVELPESEPIALALLSSAKEALVGCKEELVELTKELKELKESIKEV